MQTTGVWSYVRRLLRCRIWWYILSKTVYIKVYLMPPPFFFAAVVMEDFSWRAGMACPEDFVFDQADVLQDGKISKMELSLWKHHSTGHLMQTCSWSWTVKLMRILTIKPRFWRSLGASPWYLHFLSAPKVVESTLISDPAGAVHCDLDLNPGGDNVTFWSGDPKVTHSDCWSNPVDRSDSFAHE